MADIKTFPGSGMPPAIVREVQKMAEQIADAINNASEAGVIDSIIVAHLDYLKLQIMLDGLTDEG